MIGSSLEWSNPMKVSPTWNFRYIGVSLTMGLVVAALVGGIQTVPAFADRDGHGERGERHGDGVRYEQRGRDHDRGRYMRGRRDNRGYVVRERVYAPPAVFIAPPEPPGVSIFFPPIFFRP